MTVAPRVAAESLDERAVGMRTGELFAAHGRMVFAICRSILRDPDEAEDATQAAFLSAHEALVRGSLIREPGAWLATIARNECRGRLSGRRFEPLELHPDDIASCVTTDDDAERRATVAQIRSAIATLPEKQREAVVLRDLYGLRYGEICVALGVSRPSVEALLFRARRTLRVRLRPVGGAAIAVPAAVREGLAQAVPWFAQGRATGVSAAAGVGLIAQLGGSVTAKVAVGTVSIGVAGSAVVGAERHVPRTPAADPVVAHVQKQGARAGAESAVPVAVTPDPPRAAPVQKKQAHRSVEPTVPVRPAPDEAAAVSPARSIAPDEQPVSRPVVGGTEASREASLPRVAPELRPTVRDDPTGPRPTTTRAEAPRATTVRVSEPPAPVEPRTGELSGTTEAPTAPEATTTVRTDTQTTRTR